MANIGPLEGKNARKAKFDKPQSRAMTPPRVAPRMRTEVKNMRVRTKKNTLGGRK